jgi:hypothetical protein
MTTTGDIQRNRERFEQDVAHMFWKRIRPPVPLELPADQQGPCSMCANFTGAAATCYCDGPICSDCLERKVVAAEQSARDVWSALADHGWWNTQGQVAETYQSAARVISEIQQVPARDREGNVILDEQGLATLAAWDDWCRIPATDRLQATPDWITQALRSRGWTPTYEQGGRLMPSGAPAPGA